MWFRLSVGGGSSGAESPDDATNATTTATNNSSASANEPSKFEKFRRASFRRKSSTGQTPTRKRSKSPHNAILAKQMSSSLEEADEDEECSRAITTKEPSMETIGENHLNVKKADDSSSDIGRRKLFKSELDIILSTQLQQSDPKSKTTTTSTSSAKKTTLKSIKTDPPKRKFYKNFTTSYSTRRQKSLEEETTDAAATIATATVVALPPAPTIFNKKITDDDESEDDDEDDDDDDDDSESESSDDNAKADNLPPVRGKERILLTDPKFKHNRIEKSSSKTKVNNDLEKRESIKRSRSARKIAAGPSTGNHHNDDTSTSSKKKDKKDKSRAHTNLNLQALVKFVMNNKKFLNTDDFTLMRRKSISEAASSVITVAATCKPLPIALKYSSDGVVADAPKENDAKGERNVVLVKKQNLQTSFCDRLNNNKSMDECDDKETKKDFKFGNKEILRSIGSAGSGGKKSSSKVQRNSSNSSKSSGNYEDEAFYSCDEQENERLKAEALAASATTTTTTDEVVKRKSSSPSLTSRVAAKINEKTNNFKNRKAAAAAASKTAKTKRKQLANGAGGNEQRAEFYKQISVERLHTPSIVRQPSDRRPDAVNISLRSNGNASHNTSDLLQSSYHASSPAAAESSGSGGGGGDTPLATTPGGAGGATASGAAAAALGGLIGSDMNAQDAAAESKDARRERLHQHHQQNKSAPVSVNRSESYKERLSQKRNRNSRRKTSDPSLTSRPNDEQADLGLSNSNYTASSNSSLSSGGGSESPSTSMEQVGGGAGAAAAASGLTQHSHSMHAHHSAPHHAHQHSHQDSFHGSIGGGSSNASFWGGSIGGPGGPTIGQLTNQWNFYSDEEDDLMNETDWSSNIAAEILSALTDAEKKRQEIINEIYQTERSHVRTLKLLERLFYGPLQESGVLSTDHLSLLFPPALLSLRELHSAFEQKLKLRRVEHNHIVNHIGDLLVSMFDGLSGDELCDFAAQFCARQQIALEALKEKRRKDEQLQKLLSKAESHKACRRLQLKDLLPTVLQRLTKYPLLFENLYKVTIRVLPENTTEAEAIQKALESSKKILVDVNQAVKTAEDAHKLQNIQRKLDKSTFDKDEFKNLDLTQYRLIHDGSLTMKKNPSIQLHGLLFENMIVLLTKQDDKYSLKYLHAARNTEVNNKPVSPIMSIDSETLVRQEAADKNSFFLIKTKTSQMLELRAPSSSECKTWFKHISDAAEQYKPRSKNANHEPVDDPAIATLPHSNTKESLELTPERPPPLSATATVTTTPLAPMMPIATATSVPYAAHNNNNNDSGVQMRNGRRESTPTSAGDSNSSINMSVGSGSGAYHKQRFSQNELTPASSSVSRTMSTRSCGEPNNNNSSYGFGDGGLGISNLNGVTLRHTQSARQANGSDDTSNAASLAGGSSSIGGPSNRNSASIVYSNNSNNTRTLMQSSPPLVEPTAIQISISPAHKAEAVHTPAERLRRLDASIRDGLLEKQKIICDMFRLPVEHFNEIVDIAAMPEAPKDSADIALAAYAQVQSLTEVLNDYMHVTPEQEISAVSTAVCDHCHEKQRHLRQSTQQTASSTPSSATISSAATQIAADTPPPLPPPNKQPPLKKKQQQQQSAQQQTPAPSVTKLQTPAAALETADVDILEDDDGYCEIDELRLPALPPTLLSSPIGKSASVAAVAAAPKATSPPPPLPPPAGSFKVPPPPPPPPSSAKSPNSSSSSSTSTTTTAAAATTAATSVAVPPAELVKRQSTISADSIPEESADEVTQALNDTTIATTTKITINSPTSPTVATATAAAAANESETKEQQSDANDENDGDVQKKESQESEDTKENTNQTDDSAAESTADDKAEQNYGNDDSKTSADSENIDANATDTSTSASTSVSTAEPQQKKLTKTGDDDVTATSASVTLTAELKSSEHIEINDAYDTVASLNKSNTTLSISMVDGTTQTLPMAMFSSIVNAATTTAGTNSGAAATKSSGSHHQLLLCGPNRIQHANSLEPSVPCHALNSIVSALNAQISLLLPKINERDMERERLRKENQHLRELLNAMHERQRVEAKLETPNDTTTNADAIDEIDSGSQATPSSTATTTTADAYETTTTPPTTADAEN